MTSLGLCSDRVKFESLLRSIYLYINQILLADISMNSQFGFFFSLWIGFLSSQQEVWISLRTHKTSTYTSDMTVTSIKGHTVEIAEWNFFSDEIQ
jgi:hypothetical protein